MLSFLTTLTAVAALLLTVGAGMLPAMPDSNDDMVFF